MSTAGPYSGTALGDYVQWFAFIRCGSGDGISDYTWSFGDGSAVAHGSTPSHTYQNSGSYTVSLTVTDRHSATSIASTTAALAAAVPAPSPSPGGAGNAATFISQSLPTTMTAGQRYPVSVTMRNSGSTTWSAAHLYRLGSQNPQDNGNWGANRIYLPAAVAPGADITFNFTVVAPCGTCEENTTAQFQWRMVQDGVEWFGEQTQNQTVTIISNYQPPNGGAPVYGPFEDLFNSRLAPQYRTAQAGDDLLSRNIHWETSLVNLTGRAGLDLNLTLSYNSQATWTKTVNWEGLVAYTFDADRGSPAPGFRLGFPSIQGPFTNYQAQSGAYLLILPSGAHVELRQVGSSNVYEAVDSSYLQLLDGGNGSMLLRSPDGTQLSYWSINSEYRCTEIKDRNGNFITIKYDSINGTANLGRVTSVIDTLGRTISFNYDTNFRLQSITQVRAGQTHLWATFGYANLNVQTNFSHPCSPEEEMGVGLCDHTPTQGLPPNSSISVLTQVGFDDGSRYTFDYTSWGQIYRIRQRAADAHELRTTLYDLPLDSRISQDDCPRFTERQDTIENWNNGQPVTTTFVSAGDEHGSFDEATYAAGTPEQVSYREYSTSDYGDWLRGLVTRTETRDAAYDIKKTTTTAWARDQSGLPYALNPRPKRTATFDGDGTCNVNVNRRQTSYEYTSFGLISDVFEQGPLNLCDWEILRRTHIDYDLSPAYVNRRILGLVTGQYVFGPDALHSPSVQKLMSKITYGYDVDLDPNICTGLCADYATAANSSAIVQRDAANYGSSFTVGRGLRTWVGRWDVTEEYNETKRITSSAHYNSLGALIRTRDPLGHQTTIGYTDQFSTDGTNVSNPSVTTLAYPTTVTDADNFAAQTRYSYDLGLSTRTADPKGAAQTTEYDAAGRVKLATNAVSGAYTRYLYPTSQTLLMSATSIADMLEANNAFAFTILDGAGRVRAKASDFPDQTPHYSAGYTEFDALGRAVSQSNPIEISSDWMATGPDATAAGGYGWIFSRQTYDWNGRPLVTTNQDETTKTADYGGCGCAGGAVVTLTDEGTIDGGVARRRQQKIYADALGRTVKTQVLNWQGGSASSTVVNSYDARDQLTLVREFQGSGPSDLNDPSCPSGCQQTTMGYDGYGRLKTKHVPEQQTDPNNSASTDHTTWRYNDDDTIGTVTDARGSSQTITYNARRLVTQISYQPSAGVADTADVAFTYDNAGNRATMSDGVGSVSYVYDQESQLTSETRSFTNVSSYTISYSYDLANQLSSITYPYGAHVGYIHDEIGRVTQVTNSGYSNFSTYASNFKYRASGATRRVSYPNGLFLEETYDKRLQPSTYSAFGFPQLTYHRFNDGRLKYTEYLFNSQLDRGYNYDHTGQLTQALSGAEARGEPATNSRPYKENMTYDAFGNMTSRTGNHWNRPLVGLSEGAYVNNRMNGWSYDADGRNTSSNSVTSTFDAAGQLIQASGPQRRTNPPLVLSQQFDGDGQRVKKPSTATLPTSYAPRAWAAS